MNLFIAALHSNGYCHTARYDKLNDYEKEIVNTVPNILESYHYIYKQTFVDAIRNKGDKVFLDSGAFSAFTLGVTINVADYCEWIKTNIDIIRHEDGIMMASVVDGIGDPLQTWRNQHEMEARGVKPLPCFHFGEDEKYLEHYIENYDYITIGGLVPVSTQQAMNWLDRIWDRYLVDGSGRARLKVHAFGVTSIPLMERYPWFSCDSSSWIQSAAYGGIVTPKYGNISVSDKSPSRHDVGRHAHNFSDAEKEALFSMIENQGFNIERLSTVYESRAAYNVWSYIQIGEMIDSKNIETFAAPQMELF